MTEAAHRIYWRDTEPVEPGGPLEGDVRCDVCIVGGGYTGMWTAHFLKAADPGLDIHIIEADYAGAGASGHNDGFVTPTIGHSLWGLVHRFGLERSKAAYSSVGRSIVEIGRFCRKNGIDAGYEPNGFFLVATHDAHMARLERDVELAGKMGARLDIVGRDEIRQRIGSPALLAGLKGGGALVNPHRLARGLTRVVREAGVTIHEQTRATGFEEAPGGGAVVTTPNGRVTAPKVVIATNAYQHRFPPFRNRVKPVWSYAMVSEPIDDERLAELPWTDREGFVEAANFIVFGRLTAENRLLLGGGPAPYRYGRNMDERHLHDPRVDAALRREFTRYFPGWQDLRFTHSYGGCIAITRDYVPHIGELAPGVFYGYGYCGNGIACTHTASKSLRDLVLEQDTNYSNLLFVRGKEPDFPPEPLSYLGAGALSKLLAWQDRHPAVIKRQLV